MGKIGDLWVKLGLKKDEFDKGMKDAQKQGANFGEKMKGMGTKITAIWAAVGVAVAAIANDFIKHSQRFGDAWDRAMSRMKAAWNQFVTAVSNWDWDNFGQKMKDSMDAAAASTRAHDAEFEVMNSINLRKSEMEAELAALRIEATAANKSAEERAAAAKKYLDKVKPLYDEELALRQKIQDADLNEYLTNAGLGKTKENQEALKKFLINIAPNEDLLSALDKSRRAKAGNKVQNLTQNEQEMLGNFYQQFGAAETEMYSRLAEYYQGTRDEQVKKVTDAIFAANSAAAAYDEETRRMQSAYNTADAKLNGSSSIDTSSPVDNADSWKEAAREANETYAALREEEEAMAELEQKMVSDLLAQRGIMENPVDPIIEQVAGIAEARLQQTEEAVARTSELMEQLQREAEERGQAFSEAISQGFSAGIQELMDGLFNLTEMNCGSILYALLSPLADMAMREGEILVAAGLGVEAIKKSLESLNGVAAIAAGTALIATAAAVKSGLASLAQTGASATGTATSSGGADAGSSYINSVEDMELTVNIEGRLRGSDIVLSAQRTQANWSR